MQLTSFQSMGILAFPGEHEAHHGILLVDISPIPFFQTIPPSWVVFGSRTLLDFIIDPSFSLAHLVTRALWRTDPFSFPWGWGHAGCT